VSNETPAFQWTYPNIPAGIANSAKVVYLDGQSVPGGHDHKRVNERLSARSGNDKSVVRLGTDANMALLKHSLKEEENASENVSVGLSAVLSGNGDSGIGTGGTSS
jgi:hypothetical protein